MYFFRITRRSFIYLLLLNLFASCASGGTSFDQLADYNVVWDSPSQDYSGSMPIGNGDIGLNVWMEENGDLLFYISKTDSWGDNGRLLKVGKVRVSLTPNPLVQDAIFRQTLALENGEIVIEIADKSGEATGTLKTALRIWVDAHHPVIHVTIDSPKPLTATARIELWRTEPYELPTLEVSDVHLDRSKPNQKHAPTIVEPDTVLRNQPDRIGWYHHNQKSVGPELTMRIQGLSDYKMVDPLLHRTFGAVITAPNAKRVDDLTLTTTKGTVQRFNIYVLTEHPASPQQWLKAAETKIKEVESVPFPQQRQAHRRWWQDFWNRSWIKAKGDSQAKVTLMKPNEHPVRIGISQHKGERFKGKIARASIFNRVLSEEEIAQLAVTDKKLLEGRPNLSGCWIDVEPGKTLDELKDVDQSEPLTLEAWIQPDQLPGSGARILDKTTPGGSDGFLLDTWPGNSLRLITDAGILSQKDILTAGQWHHVAATIDNATGEIKLFHNGKKIAQQAVGGDDAFMVSRAYALQRFIDACAGRGAYPIKFNGSIFTVPNPGSPGDADYRRWGPGYWWQNTRLPYISMCTSGDFDLMQPLFRMYGEDVFKLSKYRTRHYFGHEGAYYPECIYFWGAVFSESYGWESFEKRQDKLQVSGWHKWEWVSGPELVCLMLDYYEHTQEEPFLREKILPLAKEVMLFFENYYQTGSDGKLVMHPSQAVETWWECTNPMPEVAGLRTMTRRVLELPERLITNQERIYWQAARKKLPDIPTREKDGVRMLAPAEKFAQKRNIENPELYAVYPFRQVAIGKSDLDLGIEALKHRCDKGNFGWRQDDIFMAYLGLTDQAKEYLAGRARNFHKGSRFCAFWGPNYDWIPDQDHGGILMKAFQSMILQSDGSKIYLLPAWPKQWDVEFKLHAPYQTIVQGAVRGGDIIHLRVSPESRRKDVIIMKD
jgi:hypothetical protein